MRITQRVTCLLSVTVLANINYHLDWISSEPAGKPLGIPMGEAILIGLIKVGGALKVGGTIPLAWICMKRGKLGHQGHPLLLAS